LFSRDQAGNPGIALRHFFLADPKQAADGFLPGFLNGRQKPDLEKFQGKAPSIGKKRSAPFQGLRGVPFERP